jgi:hypothetical protein
MSDEESSRGSPEEGEDTSTRDALARSLGKQYSVRGVLGRGGFAEVFEVWDEELHRRLAVKVLRPDVAWTSGTIDRFRQEARSVARLNHPNILPVHFVGDGDGIVYYVMPFVEGVSLGDRLRSTQAAMDPEEALQIVRPILDALQHAHERGLVHRDIKPDNVMIDVTTGRPLLVDFGIVKQLDGGKAHTQTGVVVGTPQYMSPEQALGQSNIDGRSDLYAVGAMLFQMVTGEPPFDGDTSQEIVAKHIAEPPPAAMTREPNVPKWLSDAIVRAMSKSPAARHQSAAAMLDALTPGGQAISSTSRATHPAPANGSTGEEAAPTEVVPVSTDATGVKTGAARGRRRIVMIGLIVVALAIVGVVIVPLVSGPVLVVENELVETIRLTVNGADERDLEPGQRVSVRVTRGRPLFAHWVMQRPAAPGGAVMGVVVEGTIVDADPRGRIRYQATSWPADTAFFAPLITNNTGQPLTVTVNVGLVGVMRCDCWVPPGATRAHVGYFPLYENSNVQVEDPDGRVAVFRNLGPEVDRRSGTVGLRFETPDLRAPDGAER